MRTDIILNKYIGLQEKFFFLLEYECNKRQSSRPELTTLGNSKRPVINVTAAQLPARREQFLAMGVRWY